MSREIIYRYCPECAGEFEPASQKRSDIGPAYICTKCGLVYHLDPKLACAGIICRNEFVLLVKRARPPQKGMWCLPGGFVDRGEALESATVREVLEETGLETAVKNVVGFYSYEGYPVVVAIYEMDVLGGELKPNSESIDARWFDFDNIPWDELAFPSARDSLREFINQRPNSKNQ